jgi:hypothetical protein
MEKIKTGSVYEVAEVLRDLFLLRLDKELSFGERKMLDTAKNLLVKEISIAKKVNEEKIEKDIINHNPSLCIVDTFVAFSDLLDMNDYSKVYKPLQKLSQIARSQKCHILIVHHKNKSDQTGSKGIMGSQAFFAAVDTCMVISGEGEQKSLLVEPRDTAKKEIKYKMNPFELYGFDENSRGLPCEDALLQKVASMGDTGLDFRSFSGYSRQAMQQAKNVLVETGALLQTGGKSGEPLRLFIAK